MVELNFNTYPYRVGNKQSLHKLYLHKWKDRWLIIIPGQIKKFEDIVSEITTFTQKRLGSDVVSLLETCRVRFSLNDFYNHLVLVKFGALIVKDLYNLIRIVC